MSATVVRDRAWTALLEIERGEGLETALDRALDTVTDPRDRALTAELIRGVLQWRRRYDRVIDSFARHPGRIRIGVRMALRLGLHQLLTLDRIPPHAAVDQSVRLARRAGGPSQSGFANGLLRSVHRRIEGKNDPWLALESVFQDRSKDLAGYLSSWHSHPPWLVRRWLARHGEEATVALLEHNNSPPPVELHVLPGYDPAIEAAALSAFGHDVVAGGHAASLQLTSRLTRDELGLMLAGRPGLIVQDGSVQQATEWLAAGVAGPLLDMCAAPGGKTIHLRALLPQDCAITAIDIEPRRLERMKDNLARTLCEGVAVVAADGCRTPFGDGTFATVLLDGPCSGTGVLRHHPDGRWRVKAEALEDNRERLVALALEAARLLRPGGRLLFATCSLESEEGEEVLVELGRRGAGLIPESGADGDDVRRWNPWRDGGDGFFAARLLKEG